MDATNKAPYRKTVVLIEDEKTVIMDWITKTGCSNFNQMTRMIAKGVIIPSKSDKGIIQPDRRKNVTGYWRTSVVLTQEEGEKLESIIKTFGCETPVQFYKLIVNGSIVLKCVGDIKKADEKPQREKVGAAKYQYNANCALTTAEGEVFKKILLLNGCDNPSQFCKKIVHGDLLVVPRNIMDKLLEMANTNLEDVIAKMENENAE